MTNKQLTNVIKRMMSNVEDMETFLIHTVLDGCGIINLDIPSHTEMSEKFWEVLGYSPHNAKALPAFESVIDAEDFTRLKKAVHAVNVQDSTPFNQFVKFTKKNGEILTMLCRGLPIHTHATKERLVFLANVNVSDCISVNEETTQLKNEYEKVFNGTQDAMFLMQVDGPMQFTYLRNNHSHREKTGISQTTIEHTTPQELLGPEGGEAVSRNYQRCIDAGEPVSYEETLDLPKGRRIWYTTLTPVFRGESITHIVGSATDITEQKVLEKRLIERAHFDSLTTLANRQYFFDRVEQCIKMDKPFILLFIDLDGFKTINDTYGHSGGDAVLKATAARLKNGLASTDFAARLGGDEFVVLRCDDRQGNLDQMMKTINASIVQPVNYEEHIIHPRASIGYARYPNDGNSTDKLINAADKAMYKVKNHSSN